MTMISAFKTRQIYLFFLIALLFASCGRNKKKMDVSNIPLTVTIQRFDWDFDKMRIKPMVEQSLALNQHYGIFYRDFVNTVVPATNIQDTVYFATLRQIFNTEYHGRHPYIDLKHEVDSVYPGKMEKQSNELTDAFRRIKYYYPNAKLPQYVYAYFSGFQAQTMLGDNYFGIGLDMFLGANSKFYPALTETLPHYITRRFTPEYIAPRVSETIIRENLFPANDADGTLLAKMIYNGKVLYMMDQVLPDVPDSVKIGYTAKQMQWCEGNKANIWAYFLQENLLYNSDYMKIQTYLNEAPFTPGLGEKNESAPKLGIWTGWQIVRQYMENHPEVTLQQLMANDDAQKILSESKYRPERKD